MMYKGSYKEYRLRHDLKYIEKRCMLFGLSLSLTTRIKDTYCEAFDDTFGRFRGACHHGFMVVMVVYLGLLDRQIAIELFETKDQIYRYTRRELFRQLDDLII